MLEDTRRSPSRRRIVVEILLVLGVSLGSSAIYAVLSILDAATRPEGIGGSSATIIPTLNDRWFFDLAYQLLRVALPLVPVVLALYLLAPAFGAAVRRIGLLPVRPRADLLGGAGLALLIGVPGIGLFFAGRALGINVDLRVQELDAIWYAVPVLVLNAVRAALQEEVLVVGYLMERLREVGLRPVVVIAISALFRGSYHLYQGVGGFVGNAVMGAVFGWLYLRFGRVAPLVVAHFLLDLVSFLGYAWLRSLLPQLFGG